MKLALIFLIVLGANASNSGGARPATTDIEQSPVQNYSIKAIADVGSHSLLELSERDGLCCGIVISGLLSFQGTQYCCDPGETCCVVFDDSIHCADPGTACCGDEGQCGGSTSVCCLGGGESCRCCPTGKQCCGSNLCCDGEGACCDGVACCGAGYVQSET